MKNLRIAERILRSGGTLPFDLVVRLWNDGIDVEALEASFA